MEKLRAEVGDFVYALADLYCKQGQYSQAEPFFQRSLAIRGKILKPDSPVLAKTLESYSELLRKTNRNAEAEKLDVQAKSIRQGRTRTNLER